MRRQLALEVMQGRIVRQAAPGEVDQRVGPAEQLEGAAPAGRRRRSGRRGDASVDGGDDGRTQQRRLDAGALERGDDVAADEAGRAAHRDLHGTHLSSGTAVTKRPPQPRT